MDPVQILDVLANFSSVIGLIIILLVGAWKRDKVREYSKKIFRGIRENFFEILMILMICFGGCIVLINGFDSLLILTGNYAPNINTYYPHGIYFKGGNLICEQQTCFAEVDEQHSKIFLFSDLSNKFSLPKNGRLTIYSSDEIKSEDVFFVLQGASMEVKSIKSFKNMDSNNYENSFGLQLDERQTLDPYQLEITIKKYPNRIYKIEIEFIPEINKPLGGIFIGLVICAYFGWIFLGYRATKRVYKLN